MMWSLEFSRPEFLWLLVVIPLLIAAHFFFLKRTHSKAMKFANFEAIKRIAGNRFVTKNYTILFLRILTFLALIISLSGLTIWHDGVQNDFDYVLAIDSSASMINTDIEPTRFDAAKSASIALLDAVDSSAFFGLVSFSGVTYVQQPLGTSQLPVRLSVANLNISRLSGTDISGAIITSTNLFADSDRGKAIILFTDGVDTVGSYVDDSVKRAVSYAKQHNVVIYPVGLGTDDAPVGYLPKSFNLTASIDRVTLNYIANETGGRSLYPETSADLTAQFEEFDALSKESQVPLEMQKYGLVVVAVLLFLEWILINLAFRRVI